MAEERTNSRPLAILKTKEGYEIITANHLISRRAGDDAFLEIGAKLPEKIIQLSSVKKKTNDLWMDYYLQAVHVRAKWIEEKRN